jgi:hypothetical protein
MKRCSYSRLVLDASLRRVSAPGLDHRRFGDVVAYNVDGRRCCVFDSALERLLANELRDRLRPTLLFSASSLGRLDGILD